MIKKSFLIFIIFSFSTVFPQNANDGFDCFTIAVGKNASANNKVLVAHNEDDWGDLTINIYKVPAKDYSKIQKIKLLNGTKITQIKHTFSYLWIETTTQKFGDYYLNEKGVSICSNQCISREDTAKGNIGFYLRRIIAERASTAKEGVKIAGKLVSELGYETSGRTYCIADKKEVWMMSIIKGHHWVAKRVPDDSIAIIPNYYTIGRINLSDTNNFLGSNDIIEYAISRNWYKPKTDGEFNFRKAYSSTNNLYSIGNIPRHWSAANMLAETNYYYGQNIPFSIKAKKPITLDNLQDVLSSHYEGTDFETHSNLHKNPHENIVNRICNKGTKFSTITEFSDKTIVWFAPINPCIHPFIPIYYNIKSIPEVYQNRPLEQALDEHFNKKDNSLDANSETAFAVFYELNKKINSDYKNNILYTKDWKKQIETNFTIKINKALTDNPDSLGQLSEDLLKSLYKKEREILKNTWQQ